MTGRIEDAILKLFLIYSVLFCGDVAYVFYDVAHEDIGDS